jgi:hypothetical protein
VCRLGRHGIGAAEVAQDIIGRILQTSARLMEFAGSLGRQLAELVAIGNVSKGAKNEIRAHGKLSPPSSTSVGTAIPGDRNKPKAKAGTESRTSLLDATGSISVDFFFFREQKNYRETLQRDPTGGTPVSIRRHPDGISINGAGSLRLQGRTARDRKPTAQAWNQHRSLPAMCNVNCVFGEVNTFL